MKTDTKSIGRAGEKAAADYLVRKGYRVIDRNSRLAHGEIDLIAENETHIIFVEVKTRSKSSARFARPGRAVNALKKQRFVSAVRVYTRFHRTELQPRIDVIEVWYEEYENGCASFEFNHIERAFGGMNRR